MKNKLPDINQQEKIKEKIAISNWTLSYRLNGLTIGLGLSVLYCYFIIHEWSKVILISSTILGYTLGWVIGRFNYTKKG